MTGRLVKILANTEMLAGTHQLEWNAAGNIIPRVYFFKRAISKSFGNKEASYKLMFNKTFGK
jgi:hypothetical protein